MQILKIDPRALNANPDDGIVNLTKLGLECGMLGHD